MNLFPSVHGVNVMSVNKKNQKLYWKKTFSLVWMGICIIWQGGLYVVLWFIYKLSHSLCGIFVSGLKFIFYHFMIFVIRKRNQLNDFVMDYEFKMREIEELDGK